MKSGKRKKIKNFLAVIIAVATLAGMIIFNILRPDTQEKNVDDFTSTIVSAQQGKEISQEKREHLRRQWERFSPETRSLIRREILRNQIRQARRETADMTREERREEIKKIAREIRKEGEKRNEERGEEIKQYLESEEGQRFVEDVWHVYNQELNAEERQDFDPLIHEMNYQINRLLR
ncbi:MAG: hypothetical protein ACOCZS_01240 [Verrucomicrobiota bacterium]